MKKIVDKIIKELLNNKQDPTIQLGEYFLTGEPIYLPEKVRHLDNAIDKAVLMEYLAETIINKYRDEEINK